MIGESAAEPRRILRRLVTELDLSFNEVGRMSGVRGETARRWERGLAPMPSERLAQLTAAEGAAAAGFPPEYPEGVGSQATQPHAAEWHAAGSQGVVCRGAALARIGHRTWDGSHARWGELAVFVENAMRLPVLIRRRSDREWLYPAASPA